MVTMLQWISPSSASAVHSKRQQVNRSAFVESLFGPNQLPHSSAQSAANRPHSRSSRSPNTFPFSVGNQAEPDGRKTFRSSCGGACRGRGPGRPGPRQCWLYGVFPDPSGWVLCAPMAKGRRPHCCSVNSTLEGGTRSCLR